MAWREYFAFGSFRILTAGAGAVFEDLAVRIDSDADFEWQRTTYNATSPLIYLRFRDESMGRYLNKLNSDIQAVGSNFAGTPFILPRPYVIQAGTNFTTEAADYSGFANTLRFTMQGAKIRQGKAPWDRRFRALVPFIYPVRQLVGAGLTASLRIEIDNDAHFLVQKISGTRTGACLINFKEGSRDRDWFNQDLEFDTVIGNGQFPNVLFASRFIYRGSVIAINLQDLTGAPNTVEIDLIGVKLYE